MSIIFVININKKLISFSILMSITKEVSKTQCYTHQFEITVRFRFLNLFNKNLPFGTDI